MARSLARTLQDHGVQLDVSAFRDLLVDTFHAMYPSWNDEDLLHNPSQALVFCNVIRSHVGCPDLPEPVILRPLSGMRKHPVAA